MFFGNCKRNTQMQIRLDGVEIEKVNEIKFLGVTIDDQISWKSHIKHVQTKVSKSIAILNRAKQVLDHKSLHILYCSIVLPYFSYCAEVWANNYNTTLHPRVILQKKAVRIIHRVGYRDHTNPLFIQSKLLKLKDMVEFQTVQVLYKAKNKLLPLNIQKLFTERVGVHSLRGKCNFRVTMVRTKRKSFCISVCGVKLWNSLNVELKECPNIQQFKKRYKECIFTRYREE